MAQTPRPAPAPAAATPAVQAKPSSDHESPLARALRTREIGDIRAVEDFGPASDSERIALIRGLLGQDWVGPRDEATLERIWAAFGRRGRDIAAQYTGLWQQCIEAGAELDELPAFAGLAEEFRADVRALARGIMQRNQAQVVAEMLALGVTEDGAVAPAQSFIPEEAQADYAAELQTLAEELVAARYALDALQQIPVGYHTPASNYGFTWDVARFSPHGQPPFGPDAKAVPDDLRERYTLRPWAAVKAHHDRLQAVIAHVANQSPVLYAAAVYDDGRALSDLAAADAAGARRLMAGHLAKLLANIRASLPKLDSGDLDDRDLVSLHRQLFQGATSASGTDWSQAVPQRIAKRVVAGHERRAFWTTLGLGSLAAVAFVVAELATLGTATFFIAAGVGVGASGTLAGRGWENWDDLATAAQASADDAGHIVTRGQADAALVAAVVDSTFVFLDLIPAVKAVRVATGARRGAGAAAQSADTAALRAAEDAAEHAGTEGAEQAARRTGNDLAEAAGKGAADDAANSASPAQATAVPAKPQRLRPNQAANWTALAQGYVGRKLSDVGVPPGYTVYEIDGHRFLRRSQADDALFARLTVDAKGIIRAGRARPQRLSKPSRVVASVGQILKRQGLGTRPPGHQVHHLIPDEVARKHPLLQLAYKRGLFDPDVPENLQLLAMKRVDDATNPIPDKVPGLSEGLPRHQGAHPVYSKQVRDEANAIMRALTSSGIDLDSIADDVLLEAIIAIRMRAIAILKNWPTKNLK